MDPISVGLQALSILKGGAGSAPAQSASNGNFANTFQENGIASWNVNMGGNGPPAAQAFRPDSFVLGLTGLNSATGAASGAGLAVANTAAPFAGANSMGMLLVVAVIAAGAAWIIKK
jgi:hypothetical protein